MKTDDTIDLIKYEKRSFLFAACPIIVLVLVTLLVYVVAQRSGDEKVWANYAIFVFIFFPIAVFFNIAAVTYALAALKVRKSIFSIASILIVAVQALAIVLYYLSFI